MAETSSRQFGLIVAYLVPGFIGLVGVSPLFPVVDDWLQPVEQGTVGFGPPIYAILSAVAVGMIVSCFRWLLLDQLHHWTGVRRPVWDDSRLDTVLSGFDYLVQNHYRYYEFYANTLVAVLWAYGMNRFFGTLPLLDTGTDLGVFLLCIVLFAGSRDALSKYYTRTDRLVGQVAEKGLEGAVMTNGNHHAEEAGGVARPRSDKQTQSKQESPAKPQQAEAKAATPAK